MITHDVDEAVLLSDRIVMMTNGPAATVGEILDIELDRPRDRLALANDPQYTDYRSQVLTFLYEKQNKVEPMFQPSTDKDEKVETAKGEAEESPAKKAS
jgi:nitrate/nitrite transport system ATP-binding protein